MAQRLTTSSINTNIPGAYPEVTVKSTPVGITNTGDIVIIGEAEGGADYTQEVLADNFFTPTQLDRVTAKYLRGPIVDAMAALTSPSNDSNIQGSAGRVYVVKTNAGTQASSTFKDGAAADYGKLTDKNYGTDGNKYYYEVLQLQEQGAASLTGSSLDPYTPGDFDGLQFQIVELGYNVVDITLGTGTHATIGDLAAEIDAFLTESTCVADGNSLKIETTVPAGDQNRFGLNYVFELVDTNTGDLAVLGLTEGLYKASQFPQVEFNINRQDTNTNESFFIEADVALSIGYESDQESYITISGGTLTSTVLGGIGSNLSIELADFVTLNDLAAFISSQPGYSATAVSTYGSKSPEIIDEEAYIGIASPSGDEPGDIKAGVWITEQALSQSAVLDFESLQENGIPSPQVKTYLQGGAKGTTLAADVINSIPALEGIKVNFVLPLFSRDASEDIADGLTDSGSTYTIDAINFAIKSHVLKMSTIKIKRNRVAMLSKWASYNDIKLHSRTLASYRCNLTMQKSSQVDSQGNVKEYMPWHTAAIAAGMQSAGFYRSLTNKFANVISFKDPSGFDSGNIGDTEDAIDAGILFMQKETAGNKWVVDQTTYGFDSNFVYNSLQATYMADVLAIQLADSLQNSFVGRSLADISSATIIAFIAKKMDEYKRLKIIGASDDAPLGYKNVKVSINGPIVDVKLEAKLATAILFIPIQLELSQIQSSSEA